MKQKFNIIILIATLLCISGIAQKTQAQNIKGTWSKNTIAKQRMGPKMYWTHKMIWVYRFKSAGTGYMRIFDEEIIEHKGKVARYGYVINAPFSYTHGIDTNGKYVILKYGKADTIKSFISTGGKISDRTRKRVSDYITGISGLSDILYWRIIKDTNHFNIKALEVINYSYDKEIYHWQKKNYGKDW